MLGGIQPDRLQSCLLKGDDDGLSARFLYIYPNPAPRQRPKHLADDRIIKQITGKLDALAPDMDENQTPCSRILPLSAAAADLFEVWWQQLLAVAPENGRMSGLWGKAQGLCLRIALVLEYLDWAVTADGLEPTEVSVRTIENAIHFMDAYAGPMAEQAHGIASKTAKEVNMRRLAFYILDNNVSEFTVRELRNGTPLRNMKAQEVKDACSDLVGYGWLLATPVREGTTVGKSQLRYLVNPTL